MKKLAFFITITLFAIGCTEDIVQPDVAIQNPGAIMTDQVSGFNLEGTKELPKIRFRKLKNGKYRMVIRDNDADTTGTFNLKMSCCPSEDFSLNFEEFKRKYKNRITVTPPGSGFEDQVVDLAFQYFSADGNPSGSEKFSVYVQEDGNTILEQPEINEDKIFLTLNEDQLSIALEIKNTAGAARKLDYIDFQLEMVLISTYNRIVEMSGGKGGDTPPMESISLNYEQLKFGIVGATGTFTVDDKVKELLQNPIQLEVQLPNPETGEILDEKSVVIKASKCCRGRIRRIRMKERVDGHDYSIVIIEDNTSAAIASYAELSFLKPLEGPAPTTAVVKVPLVKYNQENERGRYATKVPLFKEPVAGTVYTVQVVTRDVNGKALGNPFTAEVLVEEVVPKDERPIIQDVRTYSRDGGKTWNVEAIIQDRGNWVEKAQIRYLNRDEKCPRPIKGNLAMELSGETADGFEIYAAKGIKATEVNSDCIYPVGLKFFGFGTRITATQADSRTEFL